MMSSPLAGSHILVVEDEMLVMLMIEDMLADLGCASVTAAATVDQALALIAAQSFDAAMLDMNLGGHETHAVANALVERGVPYILSTGYSGDHSREGYLDVPVLKKPFRDDQLAAMLASVLPDNYRTNAGAALP